MADAQNSKKQPRGKPFAKDDPRINKGGRPPLTEVMRIARDRKANAQPEVVDFLLSVVRDTGADMKDRIAAAKSLVDDLRVEPTKLEIEGGGLTVVVQSLAPKVSE